MRARGWVGAELERREHSALLGTNSSLGLTLFDILDKKKRKLETETYKARVSKKKTYIALTKKRKTYI